MGGYDRHHPTWRQRHAERVSPALRWWRHGGRRGRRQPRHARHLVPLGRHALLVGSVIAPLEPPGGTSPRPGVRAHPRAQDEAGPGPRSRAQLDMARRWAAPAAPPSSGPSTALRSSCCAMMWGWVSPVCWAAARRQAASSAANASTAVPGAGRTVTRGPTGGGTQPASIRSPSTRPARARLVLLPGLARGPGRPRPRRRAGQAPPASRPGPRTPLGRPWRWCPIVLQAVHGSWPSVPGVPSAGACRVRPPALSHTTEHRHVEARTRVMCHAPIVGCDRHNPTVRQSPPVSGSPAPPRWSPAQSRAGCPLLVQQSFAIATEYAPGVCTVQRLLSWQAALSCTTARLCNERFDNLPKGRSRKRRPLCLSVLCRHPRLFLE
jgi:hypothetical protein